MVLKATHAPSYNQIVFTKASRDKSHKIASLTSDTCGLPKGGRIRSENVLKTVEVGLSQETNSIFTHDALRS